jgi:GNAT superfamily N-acetyltransferase
MPSEIRPIRASDDVTRFGPMHGPDTDSPRRSRSFVAIVDGAIVGVVTELRSVRHPDVAQAMGSVDRAFRRRGIGTALLRAIEQATSVPLMFMTEDPDPLGPTFLAARGYTVANESWTGRFDVRVALDALGLAAAPAGVTIEATIMTRDLADLFDLVYAERHRWAGRYTPPAGTPWITFAGLIAPPTLHVAALDGEPIAAVCVTTGVFSEGADGFVPPTGVVGGAIGDPTAVMRALLRRALVAAAAVGFDTLNLEHDTPYTEFGVIMRDVPAEPVNHRSIWMSRRP